MKKKANVFEMQLLVYAVSICTVCKAARITWVMRTQDVACILLFTCEEGQKRHASHRLYLTPKFYFHKKIT